jgi:hypothetical protein
MTWNGVEIFYTEFLTNRPKTMRIMNKNLIYPLKQSVTVILFAQIFTNLAIPIAFL